jgi:nucleoside-diphosphate-sugar epimerase
VKRVLVTGAGGFIGRHTIGPLREAGFYIHAVDIREATELDVQWHIANLHDRTEIRRVVEEVRPSHLLHLAWYVKHGEFWTSLENTHWVQSSIELLRAFSESGGGRVVSAGSCAEYEWGHDLCVEDQTPCRPSTLYGACKLGLCIIQQAVCRQLHISGAWGRVFHLYGPFEPERRFVPSVIRALLSGEPARCSHGRQVRDFMHVADVARAFVSILDSRIEGVVNIGSGCPVRQAEVAQIIAGQVGRPDLLHLGAIPAGNEPVRLIADIGRLRTTGFSPHLSLRDGLADAIAWWRERPQA